VKILIVEDQVRLGHFLLQGLSESGDAVTWVQSCEEASDALAEAPRDVIVLDLGLPDGDGLDLLGTWRRGGITQPVLILSARDSVADRVKGLDVGADDYLPKPFSLEELLARVRSLGRRQCAVERTSLDHNGVQLDLLGRSVRLDGKPVDLTSREYALLEVFMQNHGRILPRTLIAEKIWASAYDVDTNLLEVYMCRLRAKLETTPGKQLFKTVRGVGYQFV
jgi:DNA-binding response OmpR family regulator